MAAGAVREACLAALAERQAPGGGEVDVERVYRHRRTAPLDPDTGQVGDEPAHVAFACAAMKVVAEVDVELGLTRVVWIGTAQDIGKAVNPQAVEGQIEGGTAQGLGLALMEEIQIRDGVILNPNFTDYLIPTALDMPPVVSELVEDPEPDALYGVRGVVEQRTVGAAEADLSALRDATGRGLTRVPPGRYGRLVSIDRERDLGGARARHTQLRSDSADGYVPGAGARDRRGGLLVAGALGSALDVKNVFRERRVLHGHR